MVSTRTMSNVTGGENSAGSSLEGAGPSRSMRHNNEKPQEAALLLPQDISKSGRNINLLNLPQEVLEIILGYLPHRTVGHLRQVCHQMDLVCGSLLNSKFQRLQTRMLARFQAIKAQMPRRESARRNHPVACESDIIETLHMRLTLLQMSFGKHIEQKHCCFFAGEILDEVYRILHYIKVTTKLARPYKVTDELFDLSTMAMEYFKEHIEPTLPEIAYFGSEFIDFTNPFTATPNFLALEDTPASVSSSTKSEDTIVPAPPNMVLRKRIRRIKQGMKKYNNQLSMLRRDLRGCKGKIPEQQKQIVDYSSRLDDYDKKNEENSRKFSTLLQELNKCKIELQYWRSKSPANPPTCQGCGKPFVPAINEDLATLANQGVLPLLKLGMGGDVGPVPGPSNKGRNERCDNAVHAEHEEMSPKCNEEVRLGSSKSGPPKEVKFGHSKEAKASNQFKEVKNITPKRKMDEVASGDDNKKPRRVLKSRRK